MTGWAHIILVGVSIIVNAYKSKAIKWPLSELENLLDRDEIDENQLKSLLLEFISKDPGKASAELNTCMNLIVQGYGRGR